VNVDAQKDAAAARAVAEIRSGMTVGLGTGSTAAFAVKRLGARVREGLRIRGVPTSEGTRALAAAEGIPIVSLDDVDMIDVAIDGTDEADGNLDLIKGGGGALLREKVVAGLAKRFIVIADQNKLVPTLGAFPLPVEIVPFARAVVARSAATLGCEPSLRLGRDGRPFVTDNGNHILDCRFGRITDAAAIAARLDATPGVAEHGLFLGMAEILVLGQADGSVREIRRPTATS
jgi:ribose 5-phosphate isomerase A